MAIESTNPATGQKLRSYEELQPAAIANIIDQAGGTRELSSYGIKEFVNIKTVYVA